MRTDTYTKVILTIIAICLTFNIIKGFIQSTPGIQAQGTGGTIDVNIKAVGNFPIYNQSVPVTIKH